MHATDNVQDGTGNGQETTCDRRLATHNVRRDEMRRGTGRQTAHAMQHGTAGAGNRPQTTQTTRNGERAADGIRRTAVPQMTTQETTRKTPLENAHHGTMHTTDDMQHATCSGENATDDMQHATGKMQQMTRRVQQTTPRQHAPCAGNMQRITNDMQRASGAMRHAPDFVQHAANINDMQRNGQHAACNGRREACSRPQTTWTRPLTTGNKATGDRQHAAWSRHRAEDGGQRIQQIPCKTTCKRTRAHAR